MAKRLSTYSAALASIQHSGRDPSDTQVLRNHLNTLPAQLQRVVTEAERLEEQVAVTLEVLDSGPEEQPRGRVGGRVR